MLRIRDAVRNLPTYRPPLGGREGLRLDFNENTVGCSPRVLARLRALSAEEIGLYPEREPIEGIVAAHLGIGPDELEAVELHDAMERVGKIEVGDDGDLFWGVPICRRSKRTAKR